MANSYDFDVAVIGGGPAGYVAAIRASQLGAKVCLVEKLHLGGVCTNVGCIPTKVLVHAARTALELARAGEWGIDVAGVSVDYARLGERRDAVVARLRGGVGSLLKANKVELLRGEAAFRDPHTLRIAMKDGEDELSASRIFLATGSEPSELPAMPFDGESVISSAEAVALNELPESILIVGGGYIGCEFASVFSAFGVEVTVVELMDRLLPLLDEDCAREVSKKLKRAGTQICTSVKVEELRKTQGSVKVRLSDGKRIEAQKALVCTGRRVATPGVNLEAAGLRAEGNGSVAVNEHMQTSQPHIYAIGDVTGGHMLAHVASREAVVAAAHATGTLTAAMDYRVVPACVFTFPELATVGVTEGEAKRQGWEVICKRFPLRALGKAHVEGATEGFVKMVADAGTGEVLGVHIAAPNASALIAEAALGMALEATASEFAETVHAHPTMPEAISEAAEGILGLPINWTG